MHHKKKLLVPLLIVLGLITSWSGNGHAATGIVYLTSSASSVQVGNQFTEEVRINPGTAVDSVQATVNFSSSQLQLISSTFGSTFSQIQNTTSSTSVTLVGTILGSSTSSDSLIATLTFKALANSGSDNLTISNANAAYQGTYTSPSSAGNTVNFTSPPAPIVKPKTITTTATTKTTTTPTPTTTPIPTPVATPAVLNISSPTIEYSQAKLNVTSNVPVEFSIDYGTSSVQLSQSTAFTASSKSTSLDLGSANLLPGTTYYYKVIAKDSTGNLTTSSLQKFSTKGLTVSVTVFDGDNHPLKNKNVTLHSTPTTATTNSKGLAVFTNVAPGVHDVEYTVLKKTYSGSVYVTNNVTVVGANQVAPAQTLAVILTAYKPNSGHSAGHIVAILIIILGVLILAAILMTIFETPLIKNLKDKNKLHEITKYFKSKDSSNNKEKTTPQLKPVDKRSEIDTTSTDETVPENSDKE